MTMPILIMPGYNGSGPGHWQSLWEKSFPGASRLAPASWDRPDLADWKNALNTAIARCDSPPLLVAHSLSCLLVAHWSATATGKEIAGAMLVGLPDPESAAFPPEAQGFANVPTCPFPFPALIVVSSNDPYGSLANARLRARQWGAELIDAGPLGHINADSGIGDWPQGRIIFNDFANNLATLPQE